MLTFVHSTFQRSKWSLTCRPLRWKRWLQSALVTLRCSHQRKSRFAINAPSDIYFDLCIFSLHRVSNNNTLLQPKEKNKAGDILGATEKTSTDKKRERRHKKKVKRLKIKEKEQRQKLKEASTTGENKKPSKTEVAENLKKLTKGGKATILKVSVVSAVSHVAESRTQFSTCIWK